MEFLFSRVTSEWLVLNELERRKKTLTRFYAVSIAIVARHSFSSKKEKGGGGGEGGEEREPILCEFYEIRLGVFEASSRNAIAGKSGGGQIDGERAIRYHHDIILVDSSSFRGAKL